MAELLLFNVAIGIERAFGSIKFAVSWKYAQNVGATTSLSFPTELCSSVDFSVNDACVCVAHASSSVRAQRHSIWTNSPFI
jgi:hypothetical protein